MNDGLKAGHRQAIIRILAANPRIERSVLFGSRAMGTFTTTSDVDIAVYGESLTLDDQTDLSEAMAELPMPQRVDILLFHHIKNKKLIEHIRKHGVEWYVKPRSTPAGLSEIRQGTSDSGGHHVNTVYGTISSRFARSTLIDLCVPGVGVQTGPFGSQLHASDYVDDGTPIITVEHLGDNRIIHNNLPRVTDKDKERLARYTLITGDIVFSRVGSVDRRAIVHPEEEGWLFSGRCLRVRPDRTKADPSYLSWFFGLPGFQEHIRQIAVGATMPSLNTKILGDVPIYYPPSLKEQQAIACILGALDDKIELNRRMNKTLEETARAIFKSWFVDFDPVRAKAAGQHPPGLKPEIAALFPDSFEDSELGKIPKGWRIGCVGELAEVSSGKRPDARFAERSDEASVPLWGGNGPMAFVRKPLFDEPILLTGRVGTLGSVFRITDPCWPSDNTLILRANEPSVFQYLFLQLHQVNFASLNRGSTQPLLTQTDLKAQRLVVPTKSILEIFSRIANSMYCRFDQSTAQIRTLAALRDMLLPKLISGELRVADAERIVERAL